MGAATTCMVLAILGFSATGLPAGWGPPEEEVLVLPRAMAGWSRPQGLMLSVGASVNCQRPGGGFHGPLLQLELGQHAYGLSAGWRRGMHMGVPVLAWGAGLRLARSLDDGFWDGTGGRPRGDPDAWLLGPEVFLQAMVLQLEAGVLRPVSGPRPSSGWVWTAGLGIGL